VAYIKPENSKSAVNRAGEILISDTLWAKDNNDALKTINNWRYSHIYPMQKIKQTLERRAQKIDDATIIAQRLKRLPSIESKLRILGSSRLARMQDIGGCRAILETVGDVYELCEAYVIAEGKRPEGRSKLSRITDYIQEPRDTGYRSIHLLMEYESDTETRIVYNGLKIEIQLRTQLQHNWATAVETASTFLGQKLKAGIGDSRWLRFFALVSSVFALKENCPLVPNTPANKAKLNAEVRKLWKELKVDIFLKGCAITTNLSQTRFKTGNRFLLKLNAKEQKLTVTMYDKTQLLGATMHLALAEKESAINPDIDAVLVGVEDLSKLKSAYPNYFSDTKEFVETLADEIGVTVWTEKTAS
jgi:hypothetical protein